MKLEKRIIQGTKRIAAFVLALLMVLTTVSNGNFATTAKAAKSETEENVGHKVAIFYGYGGKAGTTNPATSVFKKDLNNTAYDSTAKYGLTDGDFHTTATSGKETAYGQQNAPSAVKSVDVIYGDLTYTFDKYIDGATVYLSTDGTELNLSEGTQLIKFGGGSTAWNAKSTKPVIRFFHVADDLAIVYHYADEVKLSINAGKGASYTSDFPGYSTTNDNNVFVGYSRPREMANGFDTSIHIPEGKTIDCINLQIGEKTITIPSASIKNGTYINSSYELTDDSTEAILYYKEDKLTVYAIKENISVNVNYVGASAGKNITVIGAEGSEHAITSSEFQKYVKENGGSVDLDNGNIKLNNAYSNSKGLSLAVNAAYGTVKELVVAMGEHTWTLSGDSITGNYTSYVDSKYEEVVREGDKYASGDLFKYVHSGSNKYYNFRFYEIKEDITITVHYKECEAEVVDTNGYFGTVSYDYYPSGSDATVEGNTLKISSRYLRGENAYSYRLAMKPNALVALKGIRVSDSSGTYKKDILTAEALSGTYKEEGLGTIAFSYSGGKYYIRVLAQTADKLIVTPILDYVYESKGYSNVTLEASKALSVKIESGYPTAVNVSDDYLSLKVPKDALTEGVAKKSFRWALGSTLDNDYEYYTLEVYATHKDGSGNMQTTLLTTLGNNAVSYLADKTKDQTFSYTSESISIKYNKSKYGEAQIRFWGVSGTMDFILKMNYKNYNTGEVVAADAAKFNNKQTIKLNGAHSTWTVDHEIRGMSIDTANNKVTFDGKYLNGVNVPDSSGYYGCPRFVITEKQGYEISTITVTESGNSKNTYTFEATNSKTTATCNSGALGTIYFSFDNGKYYVRFAALSVRDVTIQVSYKALRGTPYAVTTSGIAKGNTEMTFTGDDISGVSISKDLLTAKVAGADTLTNGVNGKSIRWAFSSTYGSGWEYYKIEIYSADTGKLYDTLGEDLESYLVNAEKDQTVGSTLPGMTVRYSKDKSGCAYLRVWNVSKNYHFVLYYKNYATGQVVAANQATVNINYGGKVSYNDSSVRLEMENANKTTVNVNTKLEKEKGIKYFVYTKKLGDNVESISIAANGRNYVIGKGLKSGQSVGMDVLGAKVLYYKSTDGYAQIRVWNVVGNISLTTNLSHNNKYTIFFDEGDHGIFKVSEIPDSATYNSNMSEITLLQGSVHNSKKGNGTSVRYDVTPDVGWEIDCVKVTVGGETYRLDHRELQSGKTLTVKTLPNTAIRYNVDSNGAQIRMVHVDEDTRIQVQYREDEYSLTIYTQYKGVIKAEAYETAELFTQFTDNFAVAKIVSGTTAGRVNGIKYWIKPIQKGDVITNAVVRNKFGDYVIMGDDFTEEQWQDYKIKGGIIRYYKGYDGIIELRAWGIYEDLEIICFYNGETPDPHMLIPDDVGTYDLGPYGDDEGYDDVIVEPMKSASDKNSNRWLPVVVTVAVSLVGLGLLLFLILFFLKKRKMKEEGKEEN